MNKKDSQALNKKLRVRATYRDNKNTQSSMISVNDRQQYLNVNEDSPNMRRSSIVVDPASKFTTPF